jgi:CheY-like chemotaxis protein
MQKLRRRFMKKILIVDDNSLFVRACKRILETKDFIVSCAFNGPEGLKMAEQEVPDLIILDIMLPKMDGFEVFASLSRSSPFFRVPVIFSTGFAQSEMIEKAMRVGAKGLFLKRRFTASELIEQVNMALNQTVEERTDGNHS